MPFWLANDRKGQESSHIQRFDSRFWTVDFPRPMMATVISSQYDRLQVLCDFYHEDELAGLIWESEDRYDHPLLAYDTDRDYSHTRLRFNWRSNGLLGLDEVNGPTLTIEGEDQDGNPRSWYVRLWNYATGSPTNADVELPFSQLQAGWTLPGEPVHPKAIDRMFISLAPPGYAPGSSAAYSSAKSASVQLRNISCEGERAMLEIGDVLVPPHGERIATAFDDSYNITPERMVRGLVGLGYRDDVVHYVGMSHFPKLQSTGGGALEVTQPAQVCLPAERWHNRFFLACLTHGLSVVCSISYELFDAYCPDDWKQRAADGEIARTGWVPPSALLSPANTAAMTWLQQAASGFAALLEGQSQPVRFQIGEPWWWVMADGRLCLYDDAAVQAFGGDPPVIDDMRGPLDASQLSLLDEAGALLAASTADLAQAVRDQASGSAEILLLAFTPTILDPAMPELERANLPVGWAYPAFDRLQLEDYDWLTAGADALRRAAYSHVDQKLGYPIAFQDYLSGFVLDPDDAEALWPLIDNGLVEAKERGISRRYVWALPQVNRDGYTRFALSGEDELQSFDDVLYPFALGRSTSVSPEFSTSVTVTSSGHERRNSLWSDARTHYDVGPGIRSEIELGQLLSFFRARRGPARGFRLADPFDFSSNAMTGVPAHDDQQIGIGDGLVADFQLIKNYGEIDDPQVRPITRPRADSIVIAIDGAPTADWTLEAGGRIRFNTSPAIGTTITAGFYYDVPVRFAEDRVDISGVNFAAGEAPSVPLIEIREFE